MKLTASDKAIDTTVAACDGDVRRAALEVMFLLEAGPPHRPPTARALPPTGDRARWAARISLLPREGHRRRFSEADKRQILDQAAQDGTIAAEIARRYGIDGRVVRQWKQELGLPAFVAVEITDAETVA